VTARCHREIIGLTSPVYIARVRRHIGRDYATRDLSLVGGLATARLREDRIDELRLDVHVHEKPLKAWMLMKENRPGLLNDFAILLRDRP